ncbi:winged helix-turn-helix domain-containing protein [Streptomyces sp. NPDC018031]|uniref:winged helix-turn-helix domain-containing protein n=1 Tax=Streptomyces sp. NPDC018031 TaxID=3365033 RepID=UPI0037B5960F
MRPACTEPCRRRVGRRDRAPRPKSSPHSTSGARSGLPRCRRQREMANHCYWLEEEPDRFPVSHGWLDPRWTPARIKALIGRRFHTSVTLSGNSRMLRRHGPERDQRVRNVAGVRPGSYLGVLPGRTRMP